MTPINHRDYVQIELEDFLSKHSGANVLEIGCGNTHFKEFFEEKGYKWTGQDIAEYPDASIVCKMEELSKVIEHEQFDLVFSCHSFEHCERPIDALRAFRKVLKKGGWLFLATPHACEHQILKADNDHIFVLNQWQMARLLTYTFFSDIVVTLQCIGIEKEQDWNVVSIGRKT